MLHVHRSRRINGIKKSVLKIPAPILKICICLGYFSFCYMPWFLELERTSRKYVLVNSPLDYHVPFCEYFVIPYLLWFPFVGGAFLWIIFKEDDTLFRRFCLMMFGGMTLALFIYTVFPNGIRLRPIMYTEKNICTWLLHHMVYGNDTATNVFPSLHVYTSAVIGIAASKTKVCRDHARILYAVQLTAVLIILSTIFVKQHSILDLAGGLLMAHMIYVFTYADEISAKHAKQAPGLNRHRRLV